jgi:hypothetical protein
MRSVFRGRSSNPTSQSMLALFRTAGLSGSQYCGPIQLPALPRIACREYSSGEPTTT